MNSIGANPNTVAEDGASVLEIASLKGDDVSVNTLLDHGANINHVNIDSNNTALYTAASFGKASVVSVLLKRGADTHLCSHHKSPFVAALENGFDEVAARISAYGGNKTCTN